MAIALNIGQMAEMGHKSYSPTAMPRVAPAARIASVTAAIAGLQRLQRAMARLPQRDKNYESNKRALQSAIEELRKSVHKV